VVRLRLVEASPADMIGTAPVAGLEVEAMPQSNDKPPADERRIAESDADGVVELRLGRSDFDVFVFEPDRMGVRARLRVDGPLDLTDAPLVIAPRVFDGDNDFCADQLNVTGTRGELGSSWVRVYKSSGAMSPADVLTIVPIGAPAAGRPSADVAASGLAPADVAPPDVAPADVAPRDEADVAPAEAPVDLADGVTAPGSLPFVDVYDDETVIDGSAAHADVAVWSDGREGHQTRYRVSLNGESDETSLRPCSVGLLNAFYF
jgi:hypothetical protein